MSTKQKIGMSVAAAVFIIFCGLAGSSDVDSTIDLHPESRIVTK